MTSRELATVMPASDLTRCCKSSSLRRTHRDNVRQHLDGNTTSNGRQPFGADGLAAFEESKHVSLQMILYGAGEFHLLWSFGTTAHGFEHTRWSWLCRHCCGMIGPTS